MKYLALGAVALTALAGNVYAAGPLFAESAPYGPIALFLTGNVGVRYDDNIQLGDGIINPKVSDTIFTVVPGVEADFGKRDGGGLFSVFTYAESLERYVNSTNLNTSLASVNLTSTLAGGKTTGDFNAGYSQLTANTPVSGVPGLLRRNETHLGGHVKFTVSEISKLGLGLTYDQTDYKTAGLANSKIFTVPLNYYYIIDAKNDLSLGVRYRKTQLTAPGTDFTDYYYNIGWDGEISSKLTGNISVGLNQRKPQVGKSEASLGLNSSLSWKATDKTSVNLNLSNDFGSSSAGQSQRALTAGLSADTQIAADWTGSAKVNYSSTRYPGTRVDDYWSFGVSTKWTVSKIFSLTAAYDYKDNSSSIGGANSYTGNVFSLTGSVRY